jgi:hypothetical protein
VEELMIQLRLALNWRFPRLRLDIVGITVCVTPVVRSTP